METHRHDAPAMLFIRSVPVPIAQGLVTRIRRAYPKATLAALTNAGGVEPLEATGAVDEIHPYRSRQFGLLAAGAALLLRLRRRRFDCVIVPFVGTRWLPFWNVGRMALAIGAHRTVWLPCEAATPDVDLERCPSVSFRDWRRSVGVLTRVRLAVLRLLTWPLLTVFYVGSMALLMGLAVVLLPLVWLKPTDPAATRRDESG